MNSYPEPFIARVAGVKRSRLAELRHTELSKGTDWTLENSVVCYTAVGLEKLLRAAGIDGAALQWPPIADGGEMSAPPVARAVDPSVPPGDPAGSPIDPFEKIAPGAVMAACVQAMPTADPSAPVEIEVLRLARNPRILFATRKDDGREILVRVATNANFVRGMLLKARPPATGAGVYSFEGRCPRWKGHW